MKKDDVPVPTRRPRLEKGIEAAKKKRKERDNGITQRNTYLDTIYEWAFFTWLPIRHSAAHPHPWFPSSFIAVEVGYFFSFLARVYACGYAPSSYHVDVCCCYSTPFLLAHAFPLPLLPLSFIHSDQEHNPRPHTKVYPEASVTL